ncbi:hypothetical protein [Thalassobacillus hwangdonensis]|uniref:DUF4367 domain-containing protein n=1 Tax=Thalassobacillus hwangdonensis TaxID=546108 RepID=A0ABW3L0T5_9BACI
MKKTMLILSASVLIFIGAIVIINWPETTTYDEALSTMLEEGESVEKITIFRESDGHKATVNDESKLTEIIEIPSDMELIRKDSPPVDMAYSIFFHTDASNRYLAIVSENRTDFEKSGYFEVKQENELMQVIESMELDWEAH